MANGLGAYSDLFRLENSITGLVGVGLGALVVNGIEISINQGVIITSYGISVMCFMFSWNAYNDITDIETDRSNRPGRPLPSGSLTLNEATNAMNVSLIFSILFLIIGALELSDSMIDEDVIVSAGIWILAIILLISYEGVRGNRGLKHRGLIGNIAIAAAIGMDVLFGASAVSGTADPKVISLAIMAFLFSLAREIIKDIEDMEGDIDRNTLPKSVGVDNARSIAWIFTMAAFVSLFLPFILEIFPTEHAILVFPGGLLLMLVKSKLFLGEDSAAQRLIKRSLQISMMGVIASAIITG
jgi:geranylgeranylglycerol-phosphate geranylgeranyltransferase